MRKTFGALAVLIFVLSLYGCGGGGGTTAPNPIPLKTSTIRMGQPGDTWNYSVTGTVTASGTAVNVTGNGTDAILSSIKQDPITSTNCLDEFITISLSGPSGFSASLNSHGYVFQDSTGTIYNCGFNDGSGDSWVSAASGGYFVDAQSPIATNQSYGSSVTYSDGSTETYSTQVVGTENVSTPAGYYEAYKFLLNATNTYTNGTSQVQSNIVWYVPGLGTVRETFNITEYTGNTVTDNVTVTMSLTSTSVTY